MKNLIKKTGVASIEDLRQAALGIPATGSVAGVDARRRRIQRS